MVGQEMTGWADPFYWIGLGAAAAAIILAMCAVEAQEEGARRVSRAMAVGAISNVLVLIACYIGVIAR